MSFTKIYDIIYPCLRYTDRIHSKRSHQVKKILVALLSVMIVVAAICVSGLIILEYMNEKLGIKIELNLGGEEDAESSDSESLDPQIEEAPSSEEAP